MTLEAKASETFPRPAELERDVAFWIDIFTRYDSAEGVLHDSRNLAVVYERIDIPAGLSANERRRRVQARREHYRAILNQLAGLSQHDDLDPEQRRVLALWPEDVSRAELRRAAGDIRFQQGLADRFRAGLVRAGRYRAHIHAEFAKLGIPLELAALPHVESSYNPDARSHAGASGIWQFTRDTGRRYLQVDHILDERNDPYVATVAAGKLLAYNHSITGNWPMAITAYNHGLAGVRRAMNRFGDTAYVDILRRYDGRAFGFASRNFYVAFLAALEVDQNAERYFPGLVPDKAIDYEIVTLDAYVPASALASTLGVDLNLLARYNPALQPAIWQGSKYLPRDYPIRLPASLLAAPLAELVAGLPPDARFDAQLPDLFHTVVRGDTLSAIAAAYGTRVSTLVALNGLDNQHRIRAGQRLRLPAAGPAPAVVAAAATPASAPPVAAEPEVAAAEVTAPAEAPPAVEEPPAVAAAVEPAPAEEGALPGELSDDAESAAVSAVRSGLLSDPSDYSVAADGTIEVHPLETLGHYADWLGIRTQRLRDINGFAFGRPVEVGERIKLDLSRVDAETFENRRSAYHKAQQDAFFREYTIAGMREHVVQAGESVWILSLERYRVPVWLFRQYNPELDLHRVRLGTQLNFPVLEKKEG
ncbi:MAG TPA: LysM peptidoglycan-binding domain-containing protein [Woeseiaceae bacterium]|nr:LysM peptidoglycan-binding domain-containing protein [Woeseiaceae bacterium]